MSRHRKKLKTAYIPCPPVLTKEECQLYSGMGEEINKNFIFSMDTEKNWKPITKFLTV